MPPLPDPKSFDARGSIVGMALAFGWAGVGVETIEDVEATVENEVEIATVEGSATEEDETTGEADMVEEDDEAFEGDEGIGVADGEAFAIADAEDADGLAPWPLLVEEDCCWYTLRLLTPQ